MLIYMEKIKLILSPAFSEEEFYDEVSGITFHAGSINIAIHEINLKEEKLTGIQEALRKNILIPYDKVTLDFVQGKKLGVKNVLSADAVEDATVEFDTAKTKLALPSTIQVSFDDDSKEPLAVVWDNGTPVYNGKVARSYVFEGVLTIKEGIENRKSIKAKAKVTVKEEDKLPNVVSIADISQINVENGTNKAQIGLPETVTATLDKEGTKEVKIKWGAAKPAYTGTKAGTYVYGGTLEVDATITNTKNIVPSVTVVVADPEE